MDPPGVSEWTLWSKAGIQAPHELPMPYNTHFANEPGVLKCMECDIHKERPLSASFRKLANCNAFLDHYLPISDNHLLQKPVYTANGKPVGKSKCGNSVNVDPGHLTQSHCSAFAIY